tara:strand:- start:81 stop:299 length:219 start_codon:yes stop_codon:yes gene_type:complete
MFILVVVSVVDPDFNVAEKYSVIREFPDFFPRLVFSKSDSFFFCIKEGAVKDVVSEDGVGDEHTYLFGKCLN